MNIHDSEGQELIGALAVRWVESHSYQLHVTPERIGDLAIALEDYGQFWEVIDQSGDILDMRGMARFIGLLVQIWAVREADPKAMGEVKQEARRQIQTLLAQHSLAFTGHMLARMAQRTRDAVGSLLGGWQYVPEDAPLAIEDAVEVCCCRIVNAHLREAGQRIPPEIEALSSSLDQEYFRHFQVYQALNRLKDGVDYINGACYCIKRAFLRLPPRQMETLALAYFDQGRRTPSADVSNDLNSLGRRVRGGGLHTTNNVDRFMFDVCRRFAELITDELGRALEKVVAAGQWARWELYLQRTSPPIPDKGRLQQLGQEEICSRRGPLFGERVLTLCRQLAPWAR